MRSTGEMRNLLGISSSTSVKASMNSGTATSQKSVATASTTDFPALVVASVTYKDIQSGFPIQRAAGEL